MKTKKHFFKLLLGLLLCATAMNAQIITFDFAGIPNDVLTFDSNSNNANLNVSTISRGPGINQQNNGNRFNASGWTTTNAIDLDDYFEFTINPKTSYEFSVSSIDVIVQSTNPGPRAMVLRNSEDSYATNLTTEKTIINDESSQTFTFTFVQAASITPVTYRVYMYNAEGASNKAGFEGSGNDIIVNGTVALASDVTIGFQSATSSETETDATFTSANIPVVVTNYSGTQIDVDISVTGGTAETGDYSFTSPTSLSFTSNSTQNITVDINDDADAENETIILTLTETSSVTGLVISEATHTITITDDETPVAPTAGTVFFTEFVDSGSGNSNNDYLELFNNSGNVITLSNCKVIFYNPGDNTTVELIYDFGVDGNLSSDILIPAYGFLILTKGNTRANFNASLSSPIGANVSLNAGTGNPGTRLKFQLKSGGTVDTNDGILIDDTGVMSAGAKKSRNIFTNDVAVVNDASLQSPGELEYLVYSGNSWVNAEAMNGTTATKDAYVYDDLAISANSAINNFGIIATKTATINSLIGLDIGGNLTINGDLSIMAGGSLKIAGTSSGNVTYNRTINFKNDNLKGWYLMASPVVGQTYNDSYVGINDIAENGTNNGIALYETATNTWDYHQDTESTNFISGVGYSIKREAGLGNIPFKGTLNTNDLGVDVLLTSNVDETRRFNLLGNPYTSYINSATFLNDETAISETKTMWIYNENLGTNGSYEVKRVIDALVLAPGQGFFVKANATAGTFNFDEANQSLSGADTFQKVSNSEIKLTISDGEIYQYAKISYLDEATNGFDLGYEGELFSGNTENFAVYSELLNDNEGRKYQIQTLPNSDYKNMIIPIGLNVDAGKEIAFSAEALNLPSDIKVFLEDRITNTFTRIDEVNSSYKITSLEFLNGTGRFYLHTKTSSVLSSDTEILNSVSIYKTSNTNLKIAGLNQGQAVVSLFNILGEQVMQNSFEASTSNNITLPNLAIGIYVVKLQTSKGNITKKIILE